MKITKTLSALILTAILVVGTAACGAGAETASQPSSVPTSTATSEVSLNENKNFDFDAVCKDIEINGKKYTFPFSLDDLGEGYTFDNIKYTNVVEGAETFKVYADIKYDNQKILEISISNVPIKHYGKDDDIKSFPITYMCQDNWSSSGMDKNTNYIKIAGLKIGDTNEDVKNELGEAHEIIYNKSRNGILGSYTYYKDSIAYNSSVCYGFDEDKCVDYIDIMNVIL